jgi:hypothetical protein
MLSCPGCSYWQGTHLHHAVLSLMFLLAGNLPAQCYFVLDVPIGWEPTCTMLSCPECSYWLAPRAIQMPGSAANTRGRRTLSEET